MSQPEYCDFFPDTNGCEEIWDCVDDEDCRSKYSDYDGDATTADARDGKGGKGKKNCCKGNTVHCLACEKGVTPQKYCESSPKTVGCKERVVDHEKGHDTGSAQIRCEKGDFNCQYE